MSVELPIRAAQDQVDVDTRKERGSADSGRLVGIVLPVLVFLVAIGIWELVVRVNDIAPFILPAPSAIALTLVKDWGTLFTSLLVQMARALARQPVPAAGGAARAWRRSWMLGYCTAVVTRVRAAEEAAVATAPAPSTADGGQSAALVLADRSLVIRRQVATAYPRLRKTRVTYSGDGYGDGYREGQRADIGSTKLRARTAGAIGR